MKRLKSALLMLTLLLIGACGHQSEPVSEPAVSCKVLSAMWGSPGVPVDVTARVQAQLDAGELIQANNGPLQMKTDPAPNQRKVLDLILQLNNKTLTLKIPEDGQISLR